MLHGLVALYACNDNRRRLVLAECLADLSNRLAAAQGRVLVAGADEACLLIRGEVGIECYDRLGRGIYQRCGRGGLLRSDNNGVNARLPSAVSIMLTCSSYEVAEVGDWISTFTLSCSLP